MVKVGAGRGAGKRPAGKSPAGKSPSGKGAGKSPQNSARGKSPMNTKPLSTAKGTFSFTMVADGCYIEHKVRPF